MRPRIFLTLSSIALLVVAFATALSAGPANDEQPLKLTAQILSQQYCRATEKTFSVIFRVKLRVLNQSNEKLIVENTLRSGDYGVAISTDAKSMSEGKFLFNSIVESQIEHDPLDPGTEPGGDFAVLASGKSFQTERDIWPSTVARRHDGDELRDTLRSGNYVMQITFSTWDYDPKPEVIQKRWKPFGHLVFGNISTEPVPFYLPSGPKLKKCF